MSRLALVKKTKLREPPRIALAGPEGIGKSTLAAHAPNPIWFDVNAGSGQLAVARYPFRDDEARGHVPVSFDEINAALDDLLTSTHEYQTLVIDTGDDLEKLIHKFILNRDKPKSKEKIPGINAYGYGKGFDVAVDEFRALTIKLDRLRLEKGMTIIWLCHVQQKSFKNPAGEDFDRWTMRMNEKAAGFLREWCDVVGFCYFEDVVDTSGDRAKGVSTGRRLIKFERSATHDAKSRYALPAQIEMGLTDPWGPFAKALSDAQDMTADQLIKAIEAECERVGDEVTVQRAQKYIKEADGNVETLQRVLAAIREKQSKEEVQK